MKKRKLLFTMLALSLGCLSGGSGAMAQAGWEAIYTQTQTTSDDWNPLSSDQTEGYTLGATGTTKYYYLKKTLNFTNGTAGGSGLKIQGTVYLYLPAGISITCQGADASGSTGAGAGIELSSGNTLYIIGGGTGTTVMATGGNAANGSTGGSGTWAEGGSGSWTRTGAGGTGGDGGGGAGAGIGTRGGAGGSGGSGGASKYYDDGAQDDEQNGTAGFGGTNGSNAGAMGNLYVDQTFGITVTATGGTAGSSGGSGGDRGRGYCYDGYSYNVTVAGGGGGGGGGFGGAAANIGTGGPGGGGGGGGAGGSQDWMPNSSGGVYNVNAYGGSGGTNANGSNADDGANADCSTWYTVEAGSFSSGDWVSASGQVNFGAGGSGGAKGANDASNGTQNAGTLNYNITYNPLKTRVNGSNTNPVTVTYSPSAGTNIVLPQNKDGYQWVLLTYGKSCAPNGTPDSQFATATTNYFGGHVSEAERTIILSNVYGDLYFQEIATLCKIANSGNNDQDIAEFQEASYPITVRLKDRTLYRDNHWNTICLPFNLTAEQYNSVSCPLAGATIFKMDESTTGYYPNGVENAGMHINYTSPTLLFWFENANPSTNGLQAGKPYLVKWTEGSQFTADGNYVDNTAAGNSRHELDFSNVTITRSSPDNWTSHANTSGNVVFQGTFSSSATIYAGDKTKLMLGADDKLYYPSKNINVSACRGYFILPSAAANARGVVMGFDDGETTSIQTINVTPNSQQDAPVYNLNGQRLNTPQKGINIVNGKKVIIK